MRITYDEKSRGLMIAFGDPQAYSESEEVVPGVVVDFDKNGRPLAVELEDVSVITDPSSVFGLVAPHVQKGSDLRDFREALSLTQQELGDELGVPRNTIARWERDDMPIEKPQLLSLALRGLNADAPIGGAKNAALSKRAAPRTSRARNRRSPAKKR